jgi:purine-binding chemotaxis protein CheW
VSAAHPVKIHAMAQTHAITQDVELKETSVLMFLVTGKQFAIELSRVQHILDYQTPTRTPRRPLYVEGVIQHKGRCLPLMSLRWRFGVPEAGPENPAILLLRGIGQDPVVGLLVDQVVRVLSLPEVLPPPRRVFGIRSEFIRGVANAGGRPVVWLDEAKLLTSDEPIILLA